jgi:hypothetical protein
MIQSAPEAKSLPNATAAASTDIPVLHYYWPSEFPIAICGAISTLDRLPDKSGSGAVCRDCATIYHKIPGTRANPHAEKP